MQKFRFTFIFLLIALLICILLWIISLQKIRRPEFESYFSKKIENLLSERITENDEHKLINLTNFEYLINHPCNDSNPPNSIILVHTAIEYVEKRKAIRETWGQTVPVGRIFFIMGAVKNMSLQKQLEQENDEFQDIIQGNFLDTYKNLTYKHAMVLKWFIHSCPNLDYIIKIDDDAFVNPDNLFMSLQDGAWAKQDLLLCHVWRNDHLHRNKNSRWYISKEQYPDDNSTPFCFGPAIVYSKDVARRMYQVVQKAPYICVDDVYMTGMLRKYVNVNFTSLDKYIIGRNRMLYLINGKKKWGDTEKRFSFSYPLDPEHVRKVWEVVDSNFNEN